MNEAYEHFPIRDQDSDIRTLLDLLQAWGPPARNPLHARLRQSLGRVVAWLRAGRCVCRSRRAVMACCRSQAQ